MTNITAVVVNYNSGPVVKDCIESLLKQRSIDLKIIIVDNNSKDNSHTIINAYRQYAHIIYANKNLGFGQANNLALVNNTSDYYYLLNPDAKLPDKSCLYHLLQYMQKQPKMGICGNRIIGANQVVKAFNKYPGQKHAKTNLSHLPGTIAWVLGASMLIKSHVYHQLNGFDSDFFLYGEETDLCLRARLQGYEIGFCDEVWVQHIGSFSEKTNSHYNVHSKKQDSLQRFYEKHYSATQVNYLIKREHRRAYRRLMRLKIWNKLYPNLKLNNKIQRYQAIYDVSKRYLNLAR